MRSANKSAEPLKQRARIFPANKNLDYENHNISRVLIVATKFPKEFGNASGRCKDVMPPAAAVNSNDGNTRRSKGGPWGFLSPITLLTLCSVGICSSLQHQIWKSLGTAVENRSGPHTVRRCRLEGQSSVEVNRPEQCRVLPRIKPGIPGG